MSEMYMTQKSPKKSPSVKLTKYDVEAGVKRECGRDDRHVLGSPGIQRAQSLTIWMDLARLGFNQHRTWLETGRREGTRDGRMEVIINHNVDLVTLTFDLITSNWYANYTSHCSISASSDQSFFSI